MNDILSRKLKALIAKNNLSQSLLANELNIKLSNINRYVNGLAMPRPNNLKKIADYFNVPESYFFEDHTQKNDNEADILSNDFFPLKYLDLSNNRSCYIYVPIRFKRKKDNLTAAKIDNYSMNKTFNIGDIVVIEKLKLESIKNGDLIATIIDDFILIKKFFIDKINNQCALISDNTKEYAPIILNLNELDEQSKIQIIGKIIWHANSDDISIKY